MRKGTSRVADTWAVPQRFAGEFAKGIYPGPTPSSAGSGPVPYRNTGCTPEDIAMYFYHMSRAGTAQHLDLGSHSWYGEGCWNPASPYQHPHPQQQQQQDTQYAEWRSGGRGGWQSYPVAAEKGGRGRPR